MSLYIKFLRQGLRTQDKLCSQYMWAVTIYSCIPWLYSTRTVLMIDVKLACHISKFFFVNIHFLKMQFYQKKTIAFFKTHLFFFLAVVVKRCQITFQNFSVLSNLIWNAVLPCFFLSSSHMDKVMTYLAGRKTGLNAPPHNLPSTCPEIEIGGGGDTAQQFGN